jgi:hypothetical protein
MSRENDNVAPATPPGYDDNGHADVLVDLILESGSEIGAHIIHSLADRTLPTSEMFVKTIRDVLRPHFPSRDIDWTEEEPITQLSPDRERDLSDLVSLFDVADCARLAALVFERDPECARWMRLAATRRCPIPARTRHIGFQSERPIEPDEQHTITHVMKEDTTIRRIIIPDVVAPDFLIENINVNSVAQIHSTDPVPAQLFSPHAIADADIRLDTCPAGRPIVMVVRCVAVEPRRFVAHMITTLSDTEPPTPRLPYGQDLFTPRRMVLPVDVAPYFEIEDLRIGGGDERE